MASLDLNIHKGLNLEVAVLLGALEHSTQEWRENLGSPDLEAITWTATKDGPSIGGLILHLAAAEMFWTLHVAGGQNLDPEHPAWKYDSKMDQYVPFWPAPPSEPIEWYFDIQNSVRREVMTFASAHNEPDREHDRDEKRRVSFRWILAHAIQHDAYTGGQAVLLHEQWKSQS